MAGVSDRHILLAGGTSEAGWAAARRLGDAGARVTVAGRSPGKLSRFADAGFATEQCDLRDEAAVTGLADRVGEVDGLFHLVGGWRGGGGIAGQSEDDFRFLENSLTALRHVSRLLWPALSASPSARVAVVSSTALRRPLAGGANYAAVKAATEAWTRALAHGFAKAARDAEREQTGAAVIFRVKALEGLEDDLAAAFTGLWESEPGQINDTVIDLSG